MIKLRRPKAIILDIEGTTTSMSYYPATVAPYIRNHIEPYLKHHWYDEHVQSIIKELRQQALLHPDKPRILETREGTVDDVQKSALNHIECLIKLGMSTPALLYFQMYVWLDGLMKGAMKTHLFPEVAEAIYRWRFEEQIAIFIYSSARVDVQMLMFSSTDRGSLLHCIDGHFDSKVGQKTAQETYNKISQAIQVPPQSIIFLTDDLKEAKPAKNVGYKVVLVKREKRLFSPIEASQFDIVSSFDRLKFRD